MTPEQFLATGTTLKWLLGLAWLVTRSASALGWTVW